MKELDVSIFIPADIYYILISKFKWFILMFVILTTHVEIKVEYNVMFGGLYNINRTINS